MHDREKRSIGVVVIGRNEGERLHRCLHSVLQQADQVVYVDSGSSDTSVAHARSIGVEVVELDMRIPFSAGRARNEGFDRLLHLHPHLEFVQFIDGDCDLCEHWLGAACLHLLEDSQRAIAAGRRKEKFPGNSIYNQLCDIEWNTPVGEAKACGGDFMIRSVAFQQAGGFNPSVIAGEEPELCYRLSGYGWTIHRLDHPMTMHDAAISRFTQWWKRAVRSGHAYAHGYDLHGREGKGYCRGQSLKIWWWALLFPLTLLILAVIVSPLFLLGSTAYLLQFAKIARFMNVRLWNWRQSLLYAFFTVLAKWPQLVGQLIFLKRKITGQDLVILEYH
jgi:glycosyltransferase involved in cell wall biosynthesis